MSNRPERPFPGGGPVRLSVLRKLGETAAEELPEPQDAATGEAPPNRDRHVSSARLGMSDLEYLEFAACLRPLHEKAAKIEAQLFGALDPDRPGKKRPGRKREYNVLAVLVYEVAASIFGTYSAAEDNLADPANWKRLRKAVASAHPDRPQWRLPPKPINRSKHYRFRADHLDDSLSGQLRAFARAAAVQAAQAVGILDADDKNSFTYPSLAIAGDATFIPALFKTHHTKAAQPGTKKKRADAEAITYFSNNPRAFGSAGHNAVILAARSPHGNERVIFDTDLAGHDPPAENSDSQVNTNNDASVATTMYLELLAEFPEELANMHVFIYDMAHRSIDADRVLDAGRIPLTKIPLTAEGKYAEKNLGPTTSRPKTARRPPSTSTP